MAKQETTLDEMMQVADLTVRLPGFHLYLEQDDVMRLVGEIRARTLLAHQNGYASGWAEHGDSEAKANVTRAEIELGITSRTVCAVDMGSEPSKGVEYAYDAIVRDELNAPDLQERLLKAEETLSTLERSREVHMSCINGQAERLVALENNGHERQIRRLQDRVLCMEQSEIKAPARLDAHHQRITALEARVQGYEDLNR